MAEENEEQTLDMNALLRMDHLIRPTAEERAARLFGTVPEDDTTGGDAA